jgi:hypothetical protein
VSERPETSMLDLATLSFEKRVFTSFFDEVDSQVEKMDETHKPLSCIYMHESDSSPRV